MLLLAWGTRSWHLAFVPRALARGTFLDLRCPRFKNYATIIVNARKIALYKPHNYYMLIIWIVLKSLIAIVDLSMMRVFFLSLPTYDWFLQQFTIPIQGHKAAWIFSNLYCVHITTTIYVISYSIICTIVSKILSVICFSISFQRG